MTRRSAVWVLIVLAVGAGVLWWAAIRPGPGTQQTTPAPAASKTSSPPNSEDAPPSNPAQSRASSATALTAWEERVIEIYRRVNPSVVNITSTVITHDFFFRPVPQRGTGSGFVYDEQGHIITNYHVIEGASRIEVTFPEETAVAAEVIGTDPRNDLAVLRVDVPPEKLMPVELGDSSGVRPGQLAIAIGNPFRLERTVTTGVISAVNRTLQLSDGEFIFGVIQTDAAINPGNSGGPLLDSGGRVIGINTAIFTPSGSGGSVGIGFAIPVETLKREVATLIERGRYPHPWLGLAGATLTSELSRRLEQAGSAPGAEQGVIVARVIPGSPADRAGLRGAERVIVIGNLQVPVGGDIITAIDGVVIQGMEDLIRYLETQTEVGQRVTLTFVREGREMSANVVLGERPPGQ